MAANVFVEHLRREGLEDRVRVSSSGLGPWHVGNPADPGTARVLRKAGYDDAHVAAQLGPEHLAADLLVAMDSGHLAALRRTVPDRDRVRLLREFDPDAGDDLDVPDPYGGGPRGFSDALAMIHGAVPGLLTWVRERL